MRLVALLGTLAVAALAVVALTQAQHHPEQALGGDGAGALALQLVAGLGAYAAGLDLALRRSATRSGALLCASGVALLLGAAPLPDAGGALLFTAALALGTFAPLLAGAAAAAHPAAPRPLGTAIVAVAALAVVALGLLPAAVFDPEASGCFDCPRNLLLVHGDPALYDTLTDARPWVIGTISAALAAVALVRWTRRPALVRRATASVTVGGALVAAVGATDDLWLVQCALLALVAIAVGAEALRARLLRGQIADIVVATLPSPERLREALAQRLGDPQLAIAYPGPVDDDGRPSPPPPATTTTPVARGSHVVALLYHDQALAPDRLATAARGAGPALEHASLRARLRAEVAELSASRARIVEVADDERRRAERDLHDGAQQRLIALSVALAQVPKAARAADELRTALDDLRALARGIHPASLTEAGIAAALGELAEHSRVPVRLDKLPAGRRPPAVEAAVYRLVLDAVACAEREGGAVAVSIEDVVTLTLKGVNPAAAAHALEHARDRIAALDGELAIHETAGGVRVEARCGS
jgi:signal transduction histidine kinase